MAKQWFCLSEQGAGEKRLILTKYIYQIFGEIPVRIIAFFVALAVFFNAKERREASIKFFKILNKHFCTMHAFVLFQNYANALVDKFISCMGKLKPEKFVINTADLNGFFITTHIGNVEILRSLLQDSKDVKRVNVFLQSDACEIFNNFLKALEIKLNLEVFPVEEINPETSILISDRLKDGELVFMAGDRVSAQNENKTYSAEFLGKNIELPLGTLKFALMMDAPVNFIVCVKVRGKYRVFTERFITETTNRAEKLAELQTAYVKFLEKYTLLYPHQFYHFHEIFF